MLFLTTSDDVEGVTGAYYHRMKLREPNKLALDKKAQKELWNISMKLTELSSNLI